MKNNITQKQIDEIFNSEDIEKELDKLIDCQIEEAIAKRHQESTEINIHGVKNDRKTNVM